MGYTSQDDFARDLEEIQRRSYERQKAIERGLGFSDPEAEEAEKRQRADSLARIRREEAERNRPNLVIKSAGTNADKFHTVAAPDGAAEARLIRAMTRTEVLRWLPRPRFSGQSFWSSGVSVEKKPSSTSISP